MVATPPAAGGRVPSCDSEIGSFGHTSMPLLGHGTRSICCTVAPCVLQGLTCEGSTKDEEACGLKACLSHRF